MASGAEYLSGGGVDDDGAKPMRNEVLFPLDDSDIERAERFRSEQKTAMLAILFLDMVNSTSLREDLGELRFEAIRRKADSGIRQLISKRGNADVIKGTGDGLLAVFSEPDSCVRCALDIQKYIVASAFIQVRVGLDVGQVSTESNGLSKDVFGRHVNRAARLEALGEAGHVMCSLPLWDSASGWLRHNENIAWRNHGLYILKGISEPQEVFEVFDRSLTSPLSKLKGQKGNRLRNPSTTSLATLPKVSRVEVLFGEDIEEGGAYIGSVEDAVSKKAMQKRDSTLRKLRAILAVRFPFDAVTRENPTSLKFPFGTVVSECGKTWGTSWEVRYTVSTMVTLDTPIDSSVLDTIVEKIGPYKRLCFVMSGPLAVRDIFESSEHLNRTVEELSDDEITLRLGSLWMNVRTATGHTQITVYHGCGTLRPDLHLLMGPDDLVKWLAGIDDVGGPHSRWAN